jgi:hypothetical protein
LREFVIEVDSLEAVAVVDRNEPLELKFHGTIGPSLCYVFDRFDASQTPSRVEITLWGRGTGGQVCATARSELRGRSYIKSPPHTGPVVIVVHQPEGDPLEFVVNVAE